MSRLCGLHQHLTRLVHETQQCRDMFWRISSFPVNHWTRNWTTSTKRSRTSTRSTTAKECKSKIWRSILKESHKTGIPWIQNLRRPADYSRFTQRGRTIESISSAARSSPEILKQRLEVKKMTFKLFKEIYRQHQIHWTVATKCYFNWIQGVCVDGSVATPTSSVNRYTKRAVSHPLQTGSDPELFLLYKEKIQCRNQLHILLQLRVPPQARISKNSSGSAQSSFPTTSVQLERSTEATVTVPHYGGPNEKEAEVILIDKWARRTEFRSWKIATKAKSLSLRKIPELLCWGLVKLRMLKVLTMSLPQHL